MTAIPIEFGTSILDEVENVYDDITRKAYEKFLSRGGTGMLDIEDWLEAERAILMKPEARLIEKRGHFVVRLHLPNIDPANVRILATRDDLVVQTSSRYAGARIFKTVHFPEPIDLRRVRSSWVGEKLVVMALKADAKPAFEGKPASTANEASHTAQK
jgi:HSP20 family molecular chaperone IbpA